MELDDLKVAWTELDNRLKKNEELKESIIWEMMQSKAGKSINRLLNWDIFGASILLLIIPFVVFGYDKFRGNFIMWDCMMIACLIYCVVYLPCHLYKIYGLMKIDFSGNIHENIYRINRYNIQVKRDKKIHHYIVHPVLGILGILTYGSMKATLPLWIFLFCIYILATILSYWSYKRIYDKNIESILKSLDEIRELKEE